METSNLILGRSRGYDQGDGSSNPDLSDEYFQISGYHLQGNELFDCQFLVGIGHGEETYSLGLSNYYGAAKGEMRAWVLEFYGF